MLLFNRVKNLLMSPKTEWIAISGESLSGIPLIFSYLLPLAIAAALATFLGFTFRAAAYFGMRFGIMVAIMLLIRMIIGVYIDALVTDALAPSFASEKNMNKSIQLVVYAATPIYLGSLLNLIPAIGWLGSIAGLIYAVYLFFLGIPILKKTPDDKVPIYLIAIIGVVLVVNWILEMIMTRLYFLPYPDGMNPLLH
jgi:hypothetical protein